MRCYNNKTHRYETIDDLTGAVIDTNPIPVSKKDNRTPIELTSMDARQLVPHSATPKYEFSLDPGIIVSREVLQRLRFYIGLTDTEVGWYGLVKRRGWHFYLYDVFLPEQDVHSTTTELTTQGQAQTMNDIIAKYGPDGPNDLKLWGHSHVKMGTSPSGQDQDQMDQFEKNGAPWFIRLIANKMGRMEFTIFDYKQHIVISDCPWVIEETKDTEFEKAIAEEMSAKVFSKSYQTYNSQGQDWYKGYKNYGL